MTIIQFAVFAAIIIWAYLTMCGTFYIIAHTTPRPTTTDWIVSFLVAGFVYAVVVGFIAGTAWAVVQVV